MKGLPLHQGWYHYDHQGRPAQLGHGIVPTTGGIGIPTNYRGQVISIGTEGNDVIVPGLDEKMVRTFLHEYRYTTRR